MKTLIFIIAAIYATIGFSQTPPHNSGWYFQNPTPNGNTIFSISQWSADFFAFAGEKGSITLTTNNGQTFTTMPIQTEKDIHDIIIMSPTDFLALGYDGVFKSTNSGFSWYNSLGNTPALYAGAYVGNTVYVGGDQGYIAKSTNNGISFSVVHNNPLTDIRRLAALSSNEIFASGTLGKFLHTTNGGSSWEVQSPQVPAFTTITSIDFYNPLKGAASFFNGVLTTTNGGQNWTLTTPGPSVSFRDIEVVSDNEIVTVGTGGYTVRSTNFGATWDPSIITSYNVDLETIYRRDGDQTLYTAGKFNTKFYRANEGTWNRFGPPPLTNYFPNIRNIALFTPPSNMPAASDTVYFMGDSGTVIKSTNLGETFQVLNSGTTLDLYAGAFINNNTGFIVGGRNTTGILLKTTNGGANWSQSDPLGDLTRNIYFIDAQTGIICGSTGRVRRTTNGGANWVVCSIPSSAAMHCIDFVDANTGVICAAIGAMVRTTDGGASWYEVGGLSGTQLSVSFTDMNTGVAVGNLGSMYRTTNAGQNWTLIPAITQNTFYSVSMVGELGFACGTNFNDEASILKSTNRGQTWFRTNSGTNNQLSGIVFINETTGIATGFGCSILKTTNSGTPIAVEIISNTVPVSYHLEQNYPNPFNPNTKIRFSLPKSSKVKLEVYDLLGRLVEQLADGEYSAGIYETEWKGSAFSSGVYFYRLVSEDFIETKKMILVK